MSVTVKTEVVVNDYVIGASESVEFAYKLGCSVIQLGAALLKRQNVTFVLHA